MTPSEHPFASAELDDHYRRDAHDEDLTSLAAGESEPLHAIASAHQPEARRRTSGPAAESSPSLTAQQPPDTFWDTLLERVAEGLTRPDVWSSVLPRLLSLKTELEHASR